MSEFPSTRGHYRSAPKKTGKTKTAPIPPHAFDPDEELGTDWRGHYQCRDCLRFGRDGDEHHPTGAPPLQGAVRWPPVPPEAKRLDERILGEAS